MSETDLQRIVKEAEKIAMSVHESLRGAAFNSAFELLVQQSGIDNVARSTRRAPHVPSQTSNSNDSSEEEVATLLQMDGTAYPKVRSASRVLDRALNVLRIAKDNFQMDGLSATQIAKVLTDKFRLPTTHSAVRMALDRAGDKVDRVVLDKGAIRYRLMAPGEDYLDRNGEKDANKTTPKRPPRAKTTSAQKSAVKQKAASTKNTNSKKRAGRPGPKVALTELASAGFFKSAKTIGEIQARLDEQQGYKYKSTELSPALVRLLRDKVISREKNSDGQYEYTSK